MQISTLIETSKRPPLYEKGNASMWDDNHISQYLLEMHLSQETDAASRRKTMIKKTVDWIESQSDTGPKKILDLGCGPGLYCELFASHGHEVTGVDLSARSIAYARESALRRNLAITYLQMDYLNLDFEDEFDAVILIFCDFDVLVPEDRKRLLWNVHRALKPGGLFVFDTLNQNAPAAMNIPGRTWEAALSGFWKDRPYIALSENFHYDDAGVILQQHVICSDQDQLSVYRFWTHYYDVENLTALLAENRFSGTLTCDGVLSGDNSGTGSMVTFYITRKT